MAYFAPAGTPVTLGDIARGILGSSSAAETSVVEGLRRISGLPHACPTSSGRAAMTLILKAMQRARGDPGRDEVIIPAYTCYSVPAAIERAGLKPRLCDIDPATLAMDADDLERCDFSRTLAVISANLYGLPNDLIGIEAVCRRRGVYLLDDAAQALGASVSHRAAGSFGDAGLYSFDKGKIISTFQGGAVVCRQSELTTHLEAALAALPQPPTLESLGNFAKLGVYSVFLRPALYGLIRRLPFTGLGYTRYETRYPIARLSSWQTGVAARLLPKVPHFNDGRRRLAGAYRESLDGVPGIALVRPVYATVPAFARYPFRLTDSTVRAQAVTMLNRAGIGATTSYPLSLADVPEVMARIPAGDRHCPGAREVAQSIVTLPTHAYCPPEIAERARGILIACLA